jgi:hypothetical protein
MRRRRVNIRQNGRRTFRCVGLRLGRSRTAGQPDCGRQRPGHPSSRTSPQISATRAASPRWLHPSYHPRLWSHGATYRRPSGLEVATWVRTIGNPQEARQERPKSAHPGSLGPSLGTRQRLVCLSKDQDPGLGQCSLMSPEARAPLLTDLPFYPSGRRAQAEAMSRSTLRGRPSPWSGPLHLLRSPGPRRGCCSRARAQPRWITRVTPSRGHRSGSVVWAPPRSSLDVRTRQLVHP